MSFNFYLCEVIGIKKEFIKWLNSVKPDKMPELDEEANIGAILGFILAAIVMSIGVVILSEINQATPTTGMYGCWSAVGNTLISTSQSGYDLLGVALIVTAAAAIIGILLTSFMRGRTQ